jgi:dimethylhistidine N-methyltransferase
MSDDLEEILEGLSQPQKMLSPKYFYDESGSKLFEDICELPEYYLTRTELGIMKEHIDDIAECIGPRVNIVEFGSGSGLKTRLLLEHLADPVAYVPVDISMEHLLAASKALAANFPKLEILPIAADFTRPVQLPCPTREPERNLLYFPGSTIGNFEPPAALELLRVMHDEAGPGGALLIGVDLRKDHRVIEKAYNDSQGITARFNLNVLQRLNRDFGADFDLSRFRHSATYNDGPGRIEMRLISLEAQTVSIGRQSFSFDQGESIVTEYCYKHSLDGFRDLAGQAGFHLRRKWIDPDEWFSIQLYDRR